MAWPNDPWDKLGPDYNPTNWSLGYQTSQFGVGADVDPLNAQVSTAMANPPDAMTAAQAVVPDTTHHEPNN